MKKDKSNGYVAVRKDENNEKSNDRGEKGEDSDISFD